MSVAFEETSLKDFRAELKKRIGETENIEDVFWGEGELNRYTNKSIDYCLNRIRWWQGKDFYNRMRNLFKLSNANKLKYLLTTIETPPYLSDDLDKIDVPILFSTLIFNYALYLVKERGLEDLTSYRQRVEEGILQCRKYIEAFIEFGEKLTEVPASEVPGIEDAIFTGVGKNDATSGGVFVGLFDMDYRVKITTEGATDKFKYSDDGGTAWSIEADITGGEQILNNGVTIKFDTTTGHTKDDYWSFWARV